MDKLSKNALYILSKRYLLKNKDGDVIETPEELFIRVSRAIASVEKHYGKTEEEIKELENRFHNMISNFDFLPNSPTLMNAGTELGQLSACFVLPIEDDIDSIFNAVRYTARVHKCISVKQEIETKNGLKKAKDVVIGDYIITREGWKLVTNVYSTGLKECYKITTEWNQSAIVGEDHPILTWLTRTRNPNELPKFRQTQKTNKGWKVGICLKRSHSSNNLPLGFNFSLIINGRKNCYNPILIPNITTPNLMYLFGLWFGDGSKDRLRIRFTNNNEELHKLFHSILNKKFGLSKFTYGKYGKKVSYETDVNSKMLSSYFDFIGFTKDKNKLPMWLSNLYEEHIWAFIEGWFDTDGGINKNGYVTFTNKTHTIILQLKSLLETLGIYSFVSKERNASVIYLYKGCIPRFREHMIFDTDKKRRLRNIGLSKKQNTRIFDDIAFVNYSIEPVGKLKTVDFTIEGLHEYLVDNIVTHNSGGGTGFSFSKLRPKYDMVQSTGGVASGPISFMSVFDATTEVIKQGGKRRGANMGVLRVDHPDILNFIVMKETEGKLKNFNISVAITDEFMKAVKKDEDFFLINPRTGKNGKCVKARALWNLIVLMAWKNGEPGIIFIDKINEFNPTPEIGMIESTNPCGEQPLLSWESCNLGSINLSNFVKNGRIDWVRLKEIIRLSVRFLDNVIDCNKLPLKQIDKATKANRKIGLGVMGFADLLINTGIRYNTDKALQLAKKIMKFIQDEGRQMSRELGKEKGNFPNKDKSIYKEEEFMRNATVTTIAPTGTISILSNCSSGIEPIFSIVVTRNVKDSLGKNLVEINPAVKKSLELKGLWNPELEIALKQSSCVNCTTIPKKLKEVMITAREIYPEWHVKMQSAFQKYTDNAVSKTVNLPNNGTIDDVEKVFLLAYELGCKGVTIYRDGSRKFQLLVSKDNPSSISLTCSTCD